MTKHQILYAQRRAEGLCGATGCPNQSIKSLCNKCSRKNRNRIHQRYVRNRRAGKCVYCGDKPTSNASMCKNCKEPHLKWLRKMVRLGRCHQCGGPRPNKKFKLCVGCRRWHRAWNKKTKAAAKILNRCVHCLHRPSDGETVYCRACRAKNKIRTKIYYETHKK